MLLPVKCCFLKSPGRTNIWGISHHLRASKRSLRPESPDGQRSDLFDSPTAESLLLGPNLGSCPARTAVAAAFDRLSQLLSCSDVCIVTVVTSLLRQFCDVHRNALWKSPRLSSSCRLKPPSTSVRIFAENILIYFKNII